MPSDRRRIRVWCEGHRDEEFLRKLLCDRMGFDRHSFHCKLAPSPKGSAAQWVQCQFPRVLQQARATKNQVNLGFVVMIDADELGLAKRKRKVCGHPDKRGKRERIAVLVPTWNIETWVLWLNDRQVDGSDVDESKSYKKEGPDDREFVQLCVSAVQAWDSSRANGDESLSSIRAAKIELQRLP